MTNKTNWVNNFIGYLPPVCLFFCIFISIQLNGQTRFKPDLSFNEDNSGVEIIDNIEINIAEDYSYIHFIYEEYTDIVVINESERYYNSCTDINLVKLNLENTCIFIYINCWTIDKIIVYNSIGTNQHYISKYSITNKNTNGFKYIPTRNKKNTGKLRKS